MNRQKVLTLWIDGRAIVPNWNRYFEQVNKLFTTCHTALHTLDCKTNSPHPIEFEVWEIQNGIWREKLFGNPGHEPVGSLPVNQLGLERPGKPWKGIEMTRNSLVESSGKSMNRKVRKVLETTRNISNLKKEKLLVKSTIRESFQVRKKRSERFRKIQKGLLK